MYMFGFQGYPTRYVRLVLLLVPGHSADRMPLCYYADYNPMSFCYTVSRRRVMLRSLTLEALTAFSDHKDLIADAGLFARMTVFTGLPLQGPICERWTKLLPYG